MRLIAALAAVLSASACLVLIPDPQQARAAALASTCLAFWLTGAVPAYVPTLLLLALIPFLLGRIGPQFGLPAVLGWLAEPVLALFFGGFALGLAAERHGIDAAVARLVLRIAHRRRTALLLLVMVATAGLSMWMSNIAAAAMMLAALRPLATGDSNKTFRSALLVALALGANLGGVATPVGTGPNGIAIAALSQVSPITFIAWMAFALPLTALLLAVGFGLLVARYGLRGRFEDTFSDVRPAASPQRGRMWVVSVFAVCVGLWITEPWHGVPAAVIALLTAGGLFGSGLLAPEDLRRIDWSTLLLIGGGLVLGRLLQVSGALDSLAEAVQSGSGNQFGRTLVLVLAAALLSSLMSNTATAALLIPIASTAGTSVATPVLIAIGCSLGFPFVISTPPNAMVYAEGARHSDLLLIGLAIMVIGCLLVGFTGPAVLAAFGIG